MKSFTKILSALFIILLALPAFASASQFRITQVYDGDTVKAETADTVIYILLVGIDAPEVSAPDDRNSQPFGKEAKNFLSHRILDKVVEVDGYGKAEYPHNNILGMIYLNGKNINLEMVDNGLAEVFASPIPKGLDIQPFLNAQTMARQEKKGMWVLGDKYTSPSQWRRDHQKK